MNRPIKFRAWDAKTRTFKDHPVASLRPLTQFTGLLDKNGKEIYEGDVVQHRRLTRPTDGMMYGLAEQMQSTKREVKFEACGFTPFAGWIESANTDLEWEIIGNIYENPPNQPIP